MGKKNKNTSSTVNKGSTYEEVKVVKKRSASCDAKFMEGIEDKEPTFVKMKADEEQLSNYRKKRKGKFVDSQTGETKIGKKNKTTSSTENKGQLSSVEVKFGEKKSSLTKKNLEATSLLVEATTPVPEEPWKEVGPKHLLRGLELISGSNSSGHQRRLVCEIYMMHISEASRYFPIQILICASLKVKAEVGGQFELPSSGEMVDFDAGEGKVVDEVRDVFQFCKAPGSIDFTSSVVVPLEVQFLVKNWRDLTRSWVIFCLTEGMTCPILPQDVSLCGVKNRKTLKSIMALLCSTSLEKILKMWRKRVGQVYFGIQVTDALIRKMEKNVGRVTEGRKASMEKQIHLGKQLLIMIREHPQCIKEV